MLKTNGAIGCISASYLVAAGLPAAAVQNRAGNYEQPNLKNIEEAAAVVRKAKPNRGISIVDPPKRA